jgi:predicted alpha/beta hydrolase
MTQVRLVEIKAADGASLRGTLYESRGPDAIVVGAAMGVPRRYYDAFAQYAASRGFTTLLFDYRGMGESRNSRARLEEWGSLDIAAAIDFVRSTIKPRTLNFIGQSVGGQVAKLAPNIGSVDRIVLIAAQSGYWKHWSGIRRYEIRFLWMIMPRVSRIFGYFPARMFGLGSENLPPGVASQWATWGINPRYVFGSGLPMHDFAGPLLALSFEGDNFAPPRAVEALLGEFAPAKIERRHIEDRSIGHFGFFRRGVGEKLWSEVLDWISYARSP